MDPNDLLSAFDCNTPFQLIFKLLVQSNSPKDLQTIRSVSVICH